MPRGGLRVGPVVPPEHRGPLRATSLCSLVGVLKVPDDAKVDSEREAHHPGRGAREVLAVEEEGVLDVLAGGAPPLDEGVALDREVPCEAELLLMMTMGD